MKSLTQREMWSKLESGHYKKNEHWQQFEEVGLAAGFLIDHNLALVVILHTQHTQTHTQIHIHMRRNK